MMRKPGRLAPGGGDFTRRLLLEAGIWERMRVLHVGDGRGEMAGLLQSLVGERGSVVAVDPREDSLLHLSRELAGFDAIVGRRVLMYLTDPVAAVRRLAERLKPGGRMVFQEIDLSMGPARLLPLPLHEQAHGWLRDIVRLEGRDLHKTLTQAGLTVEGVRAEAIVQTPGQPGLLADIVEAALPRILQQGVASAEQVGVPSLRTRLDAERVAAGATFIGDMMFGAWARVEGRGGIRTSSKRLNWSGPRP